MKEDFNIDRLFQKAASTPLHTSFDEAKENFSTSLAQRTASKWKILRSKNWIIMIAIITSATVAGLLMFGSNTDNSNTRENSIGTGDRLNTGNARIKKGEHILHVEMGPSQDQLETMHPAMLDSFIPMPPIEQSMILEAQLSQVFDLNNSLSYNPYIFNFAFDRREEKQDSVEIPTLTEKEIADNVKMKKKMMKALAKRHKDHYAYVPSGSTDYKGEVYSVQAFFVQVNEVSNIQYRTFLNDLLIQGREEDYKKAFPQEYQWSAQLEGDLLSIQELYFSHPAYDEYPVVNVTREGAEMYCVWLTLETNNSKYVESPMFLNDLRLPQRLEWTYAASGGNSENLFPWGGHSTQNAKDCYLANYKPDSLSFMEDGAFFTAKTSTYNPNDFGLYNMSGNVAEMVYGPTEFTSKTDLVSLRDEPGTAGGGWYDDQEALKIEGDDPYFEITEGHPNIGFRVVMSHIGSKQ